MKSKPPLKPKRPRLTRAAVEGLGHVYADAEVHLDERVGCGDAKPSDPEYRGLAYIAALIDWYWETH